MPIPEIRILKFIYYLSYHTIQKAEIVRMYLFSYLCTYFWDILKHYPYSIITELKMNSKLGEIICKIRASDYEVNTTHHT